MPSRRHALALAAILCLTALPARAERIDELPGGTPQPAAAEAADQANGMAVMSAIVLQNGTLRQSSGVVAVQKNGTGNYSLTFARPISFDDCNPVASGQVPAGSSASATVIFPPADLTVYTSDAAGAPADAVFSVILFCAR